MIILESTFDNSLLVTRESPGDARPRAPAKGLGAAGQGLQGCLPHSKTHNNDEAGDGDDGDGDDDDDDDDGYDD